MLYACCDLVFVYCLCCLICLLLLCLFGFVCWMLLLFVFIVCGGLRFECLSCVWFNSNDL